MANTTDKSILTAAGKALLAQLNAEEKPLIIDKMIFANVPNRPEFPQPDDVVPTDHIVHQEGVEQRGRLSADSVIYSTTLTSDVGPFEFNWTGAYCSEYGVLVTIDHHALTPKSADEPGVAGNTLVRSVVLEYKDIAEITNITVDASSWQYNATPRMKKMDDDVAQAIIDQNGKDWFIEDGFLVTPQASAFNIKAGAGYVSGNRVTLEFDRNVQVPNKPSFIYVDAHREGTPTGEQVTLFDFVVTAEEKDDYTDANGVKHCVSKIGQVLADGSVNDFREKDSLSNHVESISNLHTIRERVEWRPALKIKKRNALTLFSHTDEQDVQREYLPNVKKIPFITSGSFEQDLEENYFIECLHNNDLPQFTNLQSALKYLRGAKIRDGIKVSWQGYWEQSDGGSGWGVIRIGNHTQDFGSIITIDENAYIEQNFADSCRINLKKFGIKCDGSDCLERTNQAIWYARYKIGKVYWPKGIFDYSNTLVLYSAIIYKGNGRRNTKLRFSENIHGLKISPTQEDSISSMDVEDLSVISTNNEESEFSDAVHIDMKAACRKVNFKNVDLSGFRNGFNGKAPLYLCTFKNMQIYGVVNRDKDNIDGYTNDNSTGFAVGYHSNVGELSDIRDATTVTCSNVFVSGFGINWHNRYCAAFKVINCVSECGYYGVLADKGMSGSMYQEWNKFSCRNRGIHRPSGVQLVAINEPSSWGHFTADTIEAARGSFMKTLSGGRTYQTYTEMEPLTISTEKQYVSFTELNGEPIDSIVEMEHRNIGCYEVEIDFYRTNDPSVYGTYIFDIEVREDGESTHRTVKRAFIKTNSEDKYIGTVSTNYKGVVRGNLSSVKISISRVDGEAFTISGKALTCTIRRIDI